MLRLALDKAFALDVIHRVELHVYTFNKRAIDTYAGMGFVREGILRSFAPASGERWDAMVMSILRPEWTSMSASNL